VNQYLLKDLLELGLWDENLKNDLIAHNGSVQKIDRIPNDLKEIYKTVWEISQKTIIDMAADRGAYIDQVCPLQSWSSLIFFIFFLDLVTIAQHPHCRAHLCQAHVDALLCLEEGPQDGHVLPAHATCRRCDQVHRQAGKAKRKAISNCFCLILASFVRNHSPLPLFRAPRPPLMLLLLLLLLAKAKRILPPSRQ